MIIEPTTFEELSWRSYTPWYYLAALILLLGVVIAVVTLRKFRVARARHDVHDLYALPPIPSNYISGAVGLFVLGGFMIGFFGSVFGPERDVVNTRTSLASADVVTSVDEMYGIRLSDAQAREILGGDTSMDLSPTWVGPSLLVQVGEDYRTFAIAMGEGPNEFKLIEWIEGTGWVNVPAVV